MIDSTRRIIEVILSIPKGKVSCYRDVAARAGIPNGARQVVRVLHSMSRTYNLCWHRIVKADGFIALENSKGGTLQAELLLREGVEVSRDGRVDLAKFGWK